MAEISNTPYTVAPTTPASATLTAGMSASEAKQILGTLGINVNDVLSTQNIQQTINAPAPAPDDLLGIRSQLYNQLGVNEAQTAYQTQYGNYLSATNQLNKDLTSLSGRPVSVSKITGQQAQLSKVRQGDIEALGNAANLALQSYNAKKSEADTQFSIREAEVKEKRALQAQYPGAKISVGDSFDTAFSKINKYAEDQKKEAYKDSLKAMALSMGIKTKGKNTKALEKAISKVNKNAAEQAKKQADLQIRALEADIANTFSTMANRGKADDPLDRRAKELQIALAEKSLNEPATTPLQDIQAKQAELEYNYAKDQLEASNQPGFWSSVWGAASNLWK